MALLRPSVHRHVNRSRECLSSEPLHQERRVRYAAVRWVVPAETSTLQERPAVKGPTLTLTLYIRGAATAVLATSHHCAVCVCARDGVCPRPRAPPPSFRLRTFALRRGTRQIPTPPRARTNRTLTVSAIRHVVCTRNSHSSEQADGPRDGGGCARAHACSTRARPLGPP